MDWILTVAEAWRTTLFWLTGLAFAFGLLAYLRPCNPGMYWWKDLRAASTDLLYWFVVPLFVSLCRVLLLWAGVVLLFGGRESRLLPLEELPLWQQCVAILLLQDVLLYWIHRAFHSRWAWPFHAVHHSPRVLDWTATARFHPINNLLGFCLADVLVLLLGFSPTALLWLAPFNVIYSAMVHANLNWTFGPLRHVFASPVFHRWHHTTLEEGLDKNFAPTFPFLDLLFGTFYMPPGKLPQQFGTGEADFPEGFWGQLTHPFRRAKTAGDATDTPRSTLRPILVAVGVLAFVGLLGSRMYFAAQHPETPEQGTPRELCRTCTGHRGAVLCVALSADGRRIVSGGQDGLVKGWDGATGQEVFTLSGDGHAVRSVALSADGERIVAGGHDRTVRVWDARTRQQTLALTGHSGSVLSVAISADGRRIVSESADGMIKVWDAATGEEVFSRTVDAGAVPAVTLDAEGQRLIAANWEAVTVWDLHTGNEVATLTGHAKLIGSVALSGNGQRVVSGSYDDSVKVWETATGRALFTLVGHRGPVSSVAISTEGRYLVSGGQDGLVKVWDAETGLERFTLVGHRDSVSGVAISAEGRWIVSASQDGTVKVWDAADPIEP